MKKALFLLALLGGCGGAAEQPAGDGSAEGREPTAKAAAAQAIGTSRLTGLYEGGDARQRNQLCIVDRGTGNAQFGLVVWGANMHSCSGVGQAVREGDTVRLTMAGDSACELRATIDGAAVTLPQTLPAGCSYYCGAQARLSGVSFTRIGSTAEDAMKAKDLVGEPLCSGTGG